MYGTNQREEPGRPEALENKGENEELKMIKLASKALVLVLAVGLCAALATPASAVTLRDGNSELTLTGPAGMTDWIVDGTDHLYEQDFYFRVGQSAESRVASLTLAEQQVYDTNSSGQNDKLYLKYVGQAGKIELVFTLRGGAPDSNLSRICEKITITGLSREHPVTGAFFQYCDMDLAGTSGNDEARLLGPGAVAQQDTGVIPWTVAESVVSPTPDAWEIGPFASIRNSLTDGSPTTLSNSTSPLGPGDMTWAFQWNFSLAYGERFYIEKEKRLQDSLIPEPLTMLGLFMGVGGLAGYIKRRLA